jgi:thioredoxin 1
MESASAIAPARTQRRVRRKDQPKLTTITPAKKNHMSAAIPINEANFEAEVLQSTQPVLVDFWAEWCGPCKMLASVLDEIAAENEGRVKVVKINTDENQSLAARFAVRAIPTLLMFKNGQVVDQTVGAVGKKTLLSKLEKLSAAG